MQITTNITKRLEVPDSDGQWVEIRKLGWRKLREAAETMSQQAYGMVRTLGKDGLEAVKNVTPDQIEAFRSNPASQFDAGTLLRAAVIKWSLSEKGPTPEQIDELDEDVASWLLGEIVALSRPPRDEAATKNV